MPKSDPRSRSARATLAMGAIGPLALRHLFLSVLCFVLLLPFVWMVLTSLKTLGEVGLDSWIPQTPQWKNYTDVFHQGADSPAGSAQIRFGLFYWNSLFVAAWVTFLQVLTSA